MKIVKKIVDERGNVVVVETEATVDDIVDALIDAVINRIEAVVDLKTGKVTLKKKTST
jgi:Iap family predicted aminopeptidase